LNPRQQLLDELVAERHRTTPPVPSAFRSSSEHVDALQVDLCHTLAERDAALAEVEALRERVRQLERQALEHHCRPLRAVS
jgi:hypothetical protein